jgi:hypothetical protein
LGKLRKDNFQIFNKGKYLEKGHFEGANFYLLLENAKRWIKILKGLFIKKFVETRIIYMQTGKNIGIKQ